MPARVNISFADDELRRFQNMIGALGERQARVGLSRAVSRVTDMVKTRVIREVAKQSSIPQKIIRQSIKTTKPKQQGSGPIQGVVAAKGNPISLREFRAKQFAFGVKARVWGEWKRFPGTFIWAGTYRSGQAVKGGHVWQRTTAASLPIEMMRGPAVPDELVKGESLKAYEQIVRDKLPERAMHELSRLLNA